MGGIAAAFVATAGFAAACGGSSGSNSAAAPTPSATDYLTCLKDNGITIPSTRPSGGFERPSGFPSVRPSNRSTVRPSGGASGFPRGGGGFGGGAVPNGVDPSAYAKAQQACSALRPSGFPGRRGGGAADAAYRNCLSQHGVTVSGPMNQLNTADPQIAAAEKICSVLRPSATPSS
jgi:hypothetical protein